jgi:hypothetical protein
LKRDHVVRPVAKDKDGHNLAASKTADIGSVLTFAMAHGRLWAAGTNGVAYFDDGSFHSLHLRGGSPLRGISGVIEDRSGNLWINTNAGILHIPGDQVTSVLKGQQQQLDYDLFDERQGVSGGATQLKPTPSAAADKDGLLWFATSGNVFTLDPERLTSHHPTQDILLQSVSVNGVPVMDREHRLTQFTRRANELTNLEIDYIAMDLGSPEKITYEYMLEPEDKTWQQAGTRRQAFYSHLKPGEYKFRVRAQSGPTAPTFSARDARISPEYVVRITIRACGNSLRIASIASMPFISGICRPIRVTSGRYFLYASTASNPFLAWATSSISVCCCSANAIPSRTSGWSSAHKTRIRSEAAISPSLRCITVWLSPVIK